nr:hypothetical protein [Tanacetum cinerariifolium]
FMGLPFIESGNLKPLHDTMGWSSGLSTCFPVYCHIQKINGEIQIHVRVDGKEIVITESSVKRDLRLADEEDEAVHKELGDRLVRAATTTSSLEAERESGNITKTQSKATPNESSSQGTNSCGGPRFQETMGHTNAQTRVLDLEKTKTTQQSLGEDASKQGRRIDVINVDKDITLVNDADNEMIDMDDLGGEEMFIAWQNENVVKKIVDAARVSTAATTFIITTKEITLAQALKALKTSKPKVKGIVFQEPEPKKHKKKDQIRLDEEAALKLQAEFDEEERIARERPEKEQESNIALIETWDDIQAKINVDHQLAKDCKYKNKKSCLMQKRLYYVNKFEDFRLELVKRKEKRAGEELEQKITMKQNMEYDKEKAELKQLMKTIPDKEEVAIDAISLVVKSPRIV